MLEDPIHQTGMRPTRPISQRRALVSFGAGAPAVGTGASSLRSGSAAAQATPVAGATAEVVTPERVALAVERLPAIVADILQRTGVPGMAVAVVYDDAIQYTGGFGVREVGKDEPITPDTVFQLASVSKSLAATVVASVVGTGEVTWTSRLADIAPGFALHDAWPTQEVSLADLFSHRSGLPDHGGDLLEDLGFDRETILHRLRYLEPQYSFREGYAYTNFGLTAAAVAAAHAAGAAWEDLCEQRLYQPLAMASTSSRFSGYMARENRAIPHVRRDGTWQVTTQQRDPDPESPAGGVSSNVIDLTNWLRLQLGQGTFEGKEPIPVSALAPAHTPQAVSNPPADPAKDRAGFYGLGTNVSYDRFGAPLWSHSGAFNLGAATTYYMLPSAGFGIVALTNGSPVGAPEAVALTVVSIVQGATDIPNWLEIVTPDFAAIDAPTYGTEDNWASVSADVTSALASDVYAGMYHNDFYGNVEIVVSGADGLMLRIGPAPLEFPLAHFDRDTFTWQPIGENAYGLSGLTFVFDGNNEVMGFNDQYLASGGPGYLAREAQS